MIEAALESLFLLAIAKIAPPLHPMQAIIAIIIPAKRAAPIPAVTATIA